METHPHAPAVKIPQDHRVLDRPLIIPGKHYVAFTERQLLGMLRIKGVNPPMLGVRSGAADVQAPTRGDGHDHRTLEGRGPERGAADLADRFEVDAIG